MRTRRWISDRRHPEQAAGTSKIGFDRRSSSSSGTRAIRITTGGSVAKPSERTHETPEVFYPSHNGHCAAAAGWAGSALPRLRQRCPYGQLRRSIRGARRCPGATIGRLRPVVTATHNGGDGDARPQSVLRRRCSGAMLSVLMQTLVIFCPRRAVGSIMATAWPSPMAALRGSFMAVH